MSKKKTLYMGTTKIASAKTAAEIAALLGRYGATTVQSTYEAGEVVGLAFSIPCGKTDLFYQLPVKHEPILELLYEHRAAPKMRTIEHARRVAWRQVFRWIEAQLALVEVKMVELNEIFLPYLMRDNGKTLYEELITDKMLMLEDQ